MVTAVLAVVTMATIVACQGGGPEGVIRVGSKDFTEQFILGEMYALMLEDQGLPVQRKLNLGGTPVVQAGLLSGSVDLYPEYTGTALLTVLKLPTHPDPRQVYTMVAQAYAEQYNLAWLQPAPMNNTQALVMTQAAAKAKGIQTISDFVAQSDQLQMVGPPEFEAREDGLPGLKKVYGDFDLKAYIAIDPGLRYQALTDGQADVAVGFATDGEISAFNLVVLQDDRNLFPPYQVAPVVRQAVLAKHSGLKDVLNTLAPKLTDEAMRRLNYEVSGQRREPQDVARDFLNQSGLLQTSRS